MGVLAALWAAVAACVGTPVACAAVYAPGCCAGGCWAALLLLLARRAAPRLRLVPGRWAVWAVGVGAAWLLLLLLLLSSWLWPATLLLLLPRPVVGALLLARLLLWLRPVLVLVTGLRARLGAGWCDRGHGQATMLQQVSDASSDACLDGSRHLGGGDPVTHKTQTCRLCCNTASNSLTWRSAQSTAGCGKVLLCVSLSYWQQYSAAQSSNSVASRGNRMLAPLPLALQPQQQQ
jgi:hypothetical protein